MKNKLSMLVIFLFSTVSLLISLKLFWNMGIYADEAGTISPFIYGGDFWRSMDWLRLALLAVISVISGNKLLRKQKS